MFSWAFLEAPNPRAQPHGAVPALRTSVPAVVSHPCRQAQAPLPGRALSSLQLAAQPGITPRGAFVRREPQGALCESLPVIFCREVLPFFRAKFDIFARLTYGAIWSRKSEDPFFYIYKAINWLFYKIRLHYRLAGSGSVALFSPNTRQFERVLFKDQVFHTRWAHSFYCRGAGGAVAVAGQADSSLDSGEAE